MAAITWDEAAKRFFEYGVSKGVFYTPNVSGVYTNGEAWNGLINITDNPTGADNNKLWADGIEYANLRAAEQYGCSIECYTYPDGFAVCDGIAQPVDGLFFHGQARKPFGLCWRTEIGNALNSEFGYKLHIAYGLTVSPSEQAHDTVNENPDAGTFSWDAEATPVAVTGFKPVAKIEIDSRKFTAEQMAAVEAVLYGSESAEARLPLPAELQTLMAPAAGG